MYVRFKPAHGHQYVLLVQSYRQDGRVKQRTIVNFGRRDRIAPEKMRQILSLATGHGYLSEKEDG